MIKSVHAAILTRWTLVSVFGLFGLFGLFPGAVSHWRSWLSEHALLDGLMGSSWLVALLMAAYSFLIAALLGFPGLSAGWRRRGYRLAAVYGGLVALLVIINPFWLSDLHVLTTFRDGHTQLISLVLPGLALWTAGTEGTGRTRRDNRLAREWGRHLMVAGLILFMVFVGLVKIWPTEADYARVVYANSFYKWLGSGETLSTVLVWTGYGQVFAALALAGYWFSRPVFRLGLAMMAFWQLHAYLILVQPGLEWIDFETETGFAVGVTLVWVLKLTWASVVVVVLASERQRRRLWP